jgi:hypothetical protein
MWALIGAVVVEIIKFACKWGADKIDQNAERRKQRAEARKDIDNAKDQRSLFLALTRYNRI